MLPFPVLPHLDERAAQVGHVGMNQSLLSFQQFLLSHAMLLNFHSGWPSCDASAATTFITKVTGTSIGFSYNTDPDRTVSFAVSPSSASYAGLIHIGLSWLSQCCQLACPATHAALLSVSAHLALLAQTAMLLQAVHADC